MPVCLACPRLLRPPHHMLQCFYCNSGYNDQDVHGHRNRISGNSGSDKYAAFVQAHGAFWAAVKRLDFTSYAALAALRHGDEVLAESDGGGSAEAEIAVVKRHVRLWLTVRLNEHAWPADVARLLGLLQQPTTPIANSITGPVQYDDTPQLCVATLDGRVWVRCCMASCTSSVTAAVCSCLLLSTAVAAVCCLLRAVCYCCYCALLPAI